MTESSISLRQQLIRHQVAFRAIWVCAAIFLLLVAGLLPLLKSAGSLLKKIEVRSKEAEALSKKVAILTQIDQQVLKDRTKVIKAALPETKDVISYLVAVDGLSKELGLSFGGVTIAPGDVSGDNQKPVKGSTRGKDTRKVASLNVLDSNIKITGNRDGIYAFLRQVEMTLPLMQVSDVVVTKQDEDLYTMSLALGMLWSPSTNVDLKGAINLFTEKEEDYFQKLNLFRSYATASSLDLPQSQVQNRGDLFN